jgi:pilus assembly protein CpaB
MRRSPRVVVAWIAAVVVAMVTARVVFGDIAALHRRAHRLGRDVAVVVAARDLPLGTTIANGDLRTVTRPSATVPRDVVHDPRAIAGRVVAVPLLRDDAVRAAHLAPGGAAGIAGAVPPGRRAVHVVAKDGVRPPAGAVVDVLATFDPASGVSGSGEEQARVVARGAVVVATDDGAGEAGGGGVTLLVTESEARAVAYASALGQVTLAIAPPQTACCTSPPS